MAVSLQEDQMGLLLDAINFAAIKHSKQRRKDQEETPYINHPIGVAFILWKEGGINDLPTLQGAVLHDTVEDTETTFEEIETRFGQEVKELVAEVTDDKSLPKMERKRLQVVNAPHKSRKAKLIKLADKLYNLRDLSKTTPQGWTEQRVQEYYEWAAKVVRGLLKTNDALEEQIENVLRERKVSLYSDPPEISTD
jgi:guanosine-3',5'-bis(diphosphate) 3'-pyrophosphohydrolase